MFVRPIDTKPTDPPTGLRPVSDTFDPDAFDPHDPVFLTDPYPTYALFREHAPVYPVKPYKASWVFRYEDCVKVLNDTEVWIKNPPGGLPATPGPHAMMASFPEGLFGTDPPLHTKLRELLEPVFKESIQDAEAQARAIAGPLLQAARGRGKPRACLRLRPAAAGERALQRARHPRRRIRPGHLEGTDRLAGRDRLLARHHADDGG